MKVTRTLPRTTTQRYSADVQFRHAELQAAIALSQTLPTVTRRLLTAGFSVLWGAAILTGTLAFGAESPAEPVTRNPVDVSAAPIPDTVTLGNQAFKAKDYRKAQAFYQQAQSEGRNDPLLNYNLGVASYRAGDWSLAEEAFIQAAREERLKALAFYNLGLVYRAQGELEEARRWFEQVKYMATASPALKKLARKALKQDEPKRIARTTKQLIPEIYRPRKKQQHVWVNASTLAGQDSNIYRSPSDSYVDLAQTGTPLVQPVEQSGTYSRIRLDGQLRWGTHEDAYFSLKYFLDGKLYMDSEFTNANQIIQGVRFGGRLNRQNGNSSTRYNSYFEVSHHKKEAYDPDSGQDQFLNGESIANRATYVHLGPRLDYERSKGPIGIGLKFDGGINRYEGSDPLIDYTHEQYRGTASLLYKPFEKTHLVFLYSHELRNYTRRPARDATGARRLTNPNLEYVYRSAGMTLKQRLSPYFWMAFDYRLSLREDQFEGYDDYLRHSGRLALHLRSKKRLRARVGYTYQDYTFDNAFAFNQIAGGEKTLTTSYGFADLRLAVTRHFSLSAEVRYNQNQSSDPRMEYTRNQAALGVRWSL